MIDIHTLNKKLLPELKDIAKDLGVPRYQKLKKQELVYEILDIQAKQLSIDQKSQKDIHPKEKKNQENLPLHENHHLLIEKVIIKDLVLQMH